MKNWEFSKLFTKLVDEYQHSPGKIEKRNSKQRREGRQTRAKEEKRISSIPEDFCGGES